MATILNVDGSGNVVDITVSSRPKVLTVVVTPSDGDTPAVTSDETQTATELGAPTRANCTQVILTDAQETSLATVQAASPRGITLLNGAIAAKVSVTS